MRGPEAVALHVPPPVPGRLPQGTDHCFSATPAETPASETILGLSGEVTVMSKAAVSLTPQLDTRISAGLVLSSLLPKPHPASMQASR
ncbi:hypothetical protein EMCRGX_G012174 [Ephydatia muelleri]